MTQNLTLTILFGLSGGLALFLYGMKLLSEGLRKAAGDRLKSILASLTNRPLKGIFTGAFITSIIQSSSITTVTIVGLINAGLMTLPQAVTVIMGANIGTTITAQLVAFKIGKYALPIIAIGTLFLFLAKKQKYHYIAQIFLGFGILFLGMDFMKTGSAPLRDFPFFIDMLVSFGEVVLLGVLAGAAFTAIIQSSSATTALIIALSMENIIGLKAAIALVIGANIGTTVTAILACIGTSLTAKRAAGAHLIFNVVGAVVFIPLVNVLIYAATYMSDNLPRQIANAHTIFNITTSLAMIPFIGFIVWSVKKILPGTEYKIDVGSKYLEKRLLNTPSIAINQAHKEIQRMSKITIDMISQAVESLLHHKKELISVVSKKEEAVDNLYHETNYYLKKISEEKSITKVENDKVSQLLHVAHDIERVGDHAKNVTELAEKMIKNKLRFTKDTAEELKTVTEEAIKSFELALSALISGDKKKALTASKLEEKIDDQVDIFEEKHIERMKKNATASEIIYIEALRNLERISDHANNIAGSIILDS